MSVPTLPITKELFEYVLKCQSAEMGMRECGRHTGLGYGQVRSIYNKTHWGYSADWSSYLDLEGEEWMPVQGYEDIYIISNKGRLKNILTGKMRSPQAQSRQSYHHTYSFQRGRNAPPVGYTVSCLVGRHFLKEYKPGLCICHKDETLPFPEIHWVDNLWVGTQSENIKDMWSKGRRD